MYITLYEEIAALVSTFQKDGEQINLKIEALEFQLFRFASLDTFKGATAETIKDYITDVHLSICSSLKNVLYYLESSLNKMMTQYKIGIDDNDSSLIKEIVLNDAKESMNGYKIDFTDICDDLKTALNAASSAKILHEPSNTSLVSLFEGYTKEIDTLKSNISTFIDTYKTETETCDNLTNALRTFISDVNHVYSNSEGIDYPLNSVTDLSSYQQLSTVVNAMHSNVSINGVEYNEGSPSEPNEFFDNGFPYDPNEEATADDYLKYTKWSTKLAGAQLLNYLPDGTATYEHYLAGTGEDLEIDYQKAYRQDSGIKESVDIKIDEAAQAAIAYYNSTGKLNFSLTGGASTNIQYPSSENWQKAIGGHLIWVSMESTVDSSNIMTITMVVHELDRFNFNRGEQWTDIATGAKDSENGRFETIGWAKSFYTRGSMTKTVTVDLGDISATTTDDELGNGRIFEGDER